MLSGQDALVSEFQSQLKTKDEEYVKALKQQGEDIEELVDRMRTEFKELQVKREGEERKGKVVVGHAGDNKRDTRGNIFRNQNGVFFLAHTFEPIPTSGGVRHGAGGHGRGFPTGKRGHTHREQGVSIFLFDVCAYNRLATRL